MLGRQKQYRSTTEGFLEEVAFQSGLTGWLGLGHDVRVFYNWILPTRAASPLVPHHPAPYDPATPCFLNSVQVLTLLCLCSPSSLQLILPSSSSETRVILYTLEMLQYLIKKRHSTNIVE